MVSSRLSTLVGACSSLFLILLFSILLPGRLMG